MVLHIRRSRILRLRLFVPCGGQTLMSCDLRSLCHPATYVRVRSETLSELLSHLPDPLADRHLRDSEHPADLSLSEPLVGVERDEFDFLVGERLQPLRKSGVVDLIDPPEAGMSDFSIVVENFSRYLALSGQIPSSTLSNAASGI